MSSFNKYINGTDPQNFNQTYNYMRGLRTASGDPGDQRTKFAVPGDPVTGG